MAKVLIVYDTKYGNTRLVAETIARGLVELRVETVVHGLKEVDPGELVSFDAILIGSPNHNGNATDDITRFLHGLGKYNLGGKFVAVFDTYINGNYQKVTGKMERHIGEKASGLRLISPGLSLRVEDTKGPIAEGELAKCKEFSTRIADQLAGKAI